MDMWCDSSDDRILAVLSGISIVLHSSLYSMSSAASPPGSQNPTMDAYDRWSAQTPFITRTTLLTVAVVYLLSWFVDLETALQNVPYYSLLHFEVYRILLSPFVGNSILSLIMIALFFPVMSGRMESALGSSGLLAMMFCISLFTKVLFDIVCLSLSFMGTPEALFWSCDNFWVIVFGIITIECMQVCARAV
jgi:hypothetical protein